MSTGNSSSMKTCKTCGKSKPISDFYARCIHCKDCAKKAQQARYKKKLEESKKILSDPELSKQLKKCTKCDKLKPISNFRVNRTDCIDCEKAYGRNYNIVHADVREKWKNENREHYIELQANHYQKNKEKINEKYVERYHNDPEFRANRLGKDKIRHKINSIKCTNDFIGTDFEVVGYWFEYNFTEEMNWSNHGTVWDIDHVMPINRWDLNNKEDEETCFDWKNVVPLECHINRNMKRNVLNFIQFVEHSQKLLKYFNEKELDKYEFFDFHCKCLKKITSYDITHSTILKCETP